MKFIVSLVVLTAAVYVSPVSGQSLNRKNSRDSMLANYSKIMDSDFGLSKEQQQKWKQAFLKQDACINAVLENRSLQPGDQKQNAIKACINTYRQEVDAILTSEQKVLKAAHAEKLFEKSKNQNKKG